jgi:hypothetical protein
MSSLAWNSSAVLPAKQLQPPKKVCTVLHFVLFCLVHFIFAYHYLKIINLLWLGICLLSFHPSLMMRKFCGCHQFMSLRGQEQI